MKRILLFSAIALSTLTFGQNVPNYVPTNGLVGWWPFNGNANDESGNGFNGNVNGASLSTDRFGVLNNAYVFDGLNDCISISNSSNIIFSNGYSFSCWFNASSLKMASLIDKMAGTNANCNNENGFRTCVRSTGGIESQTGCYGSPSGIAQSQMNYQINEWYHCVGTVGLDDSVRIYINGNIFETKSVIIGLSGLINSKQIEVGRGSWASSYENFNGKIDDVAIWNRALTQQEIIDLYSGCNSINASINLSNPSTIGSNLTLSVLATGNNLNYQWETNPCKNGWQTVSSNSTYSGVSTSDLTVSNLELSNHQQPFRVIVSDNNCSDTSDVVYVEITDTCINTVTQSVAVTDTLIIDISLAGLSAPNNINTIKVYPNPSNDVVYIDNGDYALMNGYSIKIINALGQEKFNNAINIPAFQIPVSQLGAVGVYYINIYDNQQQLVESKVLVLE